MALRNLQRTVGVLAALIFTFSGAALAEPGDPTVDEVVRGMLARAKWEDEKKVDSLYTYDYTSTSEKLNADGSLKERTEREFEGVVVDGAPFWRLVRKDGKPLEGKDLEKEREREEKFRKKLAERRAKPKDKDDDDSVELNAELIQRFNANYAGREPVNGRPAHILTFAPKPGKLPEKRRMDKVLNRLTGRVWLDVETYAITRVEFFLTEPTSFYGFLGTIRELDLRMEKREIEPGIFVPAHFQVRYVGRQLFSNLHVKAESRYSGHRKAAPAAAAQVSQPQ